MKIIRQKEFGRTGKTAQEVKQILKPVGNKAVRKANKKKYILDTYGKQAEEIVAKDKNSGISHQGAVDPILGEARGLSRTLIGGSKADKMVNSNWVSSYYDIPHFGTTLTSRDMEQAKKKFIGNKSEKSSLFPYTRLEHTHIHKKKK